MIESVVSWLLTLVGFGSLAFTVKHVAFPAKFVWIIAFGLLGVEGLVSALYQLGGSLIVLLPVTIIIKSIVDVTGMLALLVGAYSAVHQNTGVSPHIYSLPTGCAPLAQLSQWVPSHWIAAAMLLPFLLYSITKAPKPTFALPCVCFLVARVLLSEYPVAVGSLLSSAQLSFVLSSIGAALAAAAALGKMPAALAGKKLI